MKIKSKNYIFLIQSRKCPGGGNVLGGICPVGKCPDGECLELISEYIPEENILI